MSSFADNNQSEAPPCYVLAENWPTLLVFLALDTAWQINGMSGYYQGLHYPSVKTVMWAHGIKKADQAEVFSGVQVMECAAMTAINSKLKK